MFQCDDITAMSEDYVCTLDAKTTRKAKDELGEDPKERMSQVETFRKWIQEQPHLRCPTGNTCHTFMGELGDAERYHIVTKWWVASLNPVWLSFTLHYVDRTLFWVSLTRHHLCGNGTYIQPKTHLRSYTRPRYLVSRTPNSTVISTLYIIPTRLISEKAVSTAKRTHMSSVHVQAFSVTELRAPRTSL